MTRSPGSLVPSGSGQPEPEKQDGKALNCRQEGEANLRAATEVNARIGPCGHGRRRSLRTGEKSAFFRFLLSAIEWSRGPSSSSWNRSSKLISNRGRMDTDRNGQRIKR